jgi:phosphohistidine swiveling domain-containing protein
MAYTIPLQHLDKNNIATAGGKGANLGEMMNAGFPVPPGFVLIAEAYDAFVQEHGLRQQIIDLASGVSADDPQSSEGAFAAIKRLFLAAEMPEAIREDLLAAHADLTSDGDIPVAVRSSATAEDLCTSSSAGQQDTYLNIQGEGALLEAVKECWASLWTARAISYRMHQDIDPATVSLAVVVQQLVPADSAGILFTAHPLDGTREQVVINATWGLGEAIVSGKVTPDTVIVDKASQRVLSRETTTKTIMTARTDHGTEEQPIPQSRRDQQVLDDATAAELARYGAQIEAHYGLPMDIEWAISDDKVALLQARPITNLPPAPLKDVRWEPPRPGTIWMRRQIVEHMPEPLSPLFDELYLRNGLDHSMETLTVFMGDLSGIEINLWDFIEPPFAATVNGYAYSIASFNLGPKLVPLALRIYVVVLPKMIRHLLPRWRDESLPGYRAVIEQWKGIDLPNASDEELLRGVRELATEDAIYWFAAAVPLGLARVTDAALNRFLKSVSNGSRLTSGTFLRGFPSKAAEAQAQLEDAAREIHGSDTLRELVSNTPASRLLLTLAEHPDGQSVVDDLQRYLDTYGHQIYNLDFAAPTLADDPLPVLLSLKTAVAHPGRDARARQSKLAQERELLVARTERSLNPIQRPIFRRLLRWAQRYSPHREEALFYVGAAWPTLRRLAHELGQRLAEAGSLDASDDVFYLKSAELAAASAARANGVSQPELAKLAQERCILHEARKRLEPPVSIPPDGRMKFGPIDMAMFEPKPRSVSVGPVLEGFAVSPGTATAPASVISSPEDFDKMAPDSILVCTTTTPAWTPLFAQAKGLVTDIGGALAHGSIVAREYGIPAVMGTGVATQRIESGQLVRVDGDRGTVTLVDEADAQEYETMQAQRVAEKKAAAKKRKVILALVAGIAVVLALWWKKRR